MSRGLLCGQYRRVGPCLYFMEALLKSVGLHVLTRSSYRLVRSMPGFGLLQAGDAAALERLTALEDKWLAHDGEQGLSSMAAENSGRPSSYYI